MENITLSAAKKLVEEALKRERPKAVAKIHSLMAEYGITFEQLGFASPAAAVSAPVAQASVKSKTKTKKKAKGPYHPKLAYKYMKDGIGYVGTGRRPAWVEAVIKAGEDLEKFRVGAKPAPVAVRKSPASKSKVKAKNKPATKAKATTKSKPAAKAKTATKAKPAAKKKPAAQSKPAAKAKVVKPKAKAKATKTKAKPKAKTKSPAKPVSTAKSAGAVQASM